MNPITHGVLVPMITPTHPDGSINVDGVKYMAEVFINAGVAGLVVCGTTGEYYALSTAERELVLNAVAEIGKGRVNLVAGISRLAGKSSTG